MVTKGVNIEGNSSSTVSVNTHRTSNNKASVSDQWATGLKHKKILPTLIVNHYFQPR